MEQAEIAATPRRMDPLVRLRIHTIAWFGGAFVAGLAVGVSVAVLVFTSKLEARDDQLAELAQLHGGGLGPVASQGSQPGDELASLQAFSAAALPALRNTVSGPTVSGPSLAPVADRSAIAASMPVPATMPVPPVASLASPVLISALVARGSAAPNQAAAVAAPVPARPPVGAILPSRPEVTATTEAPPRAMAASSATVADFKAEARKARERLELEERALAATARATAATVTAGKRKAPVERPTAVVQAPILAAVPTPPPEVPYGPTQRITYEAAKIAEIGNGIVKFKSGLTVAVGENFPAGEQLKSVNPVTGEILTSKRRIVVTRDAPPAVAQ